MVAGRLTFLFIMPRSKFWWKSFKSLTFSFHCQQTDRISHWIIAIKPYRLHCCGFIRFRFVFFWPSFCSVASGRFCCDEKRQSINDWRVFPLSAGFDEVRDWREGGRWYYGYDELAGYMGTLVAIHRLVSLSHGEEVLKVSSWERARQLDRQRRTRMNWLHMAENLQPIEITFCITSIKTCCLLMKYT